MDRRMDQQTASYGRKHVTKNEKGKKKERQEKKRRGRDIRKKNTIAIIEGL